MADDYNIVHDRMQSALSLTHHIQNRIVQSMARGEVSTNIAADVKRMAEQLVDQFNRAATEGSSEG